jgi:CRISPR-associated protein Cas2
MWLFALFDLPVVTRVQRKRAVKFRNLLLREGFSMLQLSVYARYCASEDIGDRFVDRLRGQLPPEGQVRLLLVTDRQFGKMRVFYGKTAKEPEPPPSQRLLF